MQQLAKRTAHAKINLGLTILGKRSDGYHDLETIFCPIALADELTFSPSDQGISLTVDGIAVPADGSNLCVKAAEALQKHISPPSGIHIHLRKNIPVGSGLGGGSSDAACVLSTLQELWRVEIPTDELASIASSLGADVPYFLRGGLALGTGKGDRLERLDVPFPYWIVVVVPPVLVSTAWAYQALRPVSARTPARLASQFPGSIHRLDELERLLQNDFEPVVMSHHAEVTACRERLVASGLRCVRMSGSGSAMFGLTTDRETAFRAIQAFSSSHVVSITPPGRA